MDRGQPSTTSTILNLTQICSLPFEQLGDIWNVEAKRPVPHNIFQMYDLQSQFFFLITGLNFFAWINHTLFQQIWRPSIQWGLGNLLAKILAQRHLNLFSFHCPGRFGSSSVVLLCCFRELVVTKVPIPSKCRAKGSFLARL